MLKHENPSRNPPRPKNRYQKDDSKRRAVRGYPRGKEASRSENRNKQRTHSHAQTIDSSDTERRNDLGNGEQSQDSDHVRVSIMRERKDNIVEPTGEQRGHAQTRNDSSPRDNSLRKGSEAYGVIQQDDQSSNDDGSHKCDVEKHIVHTRYHHDDQVQCDQHLGPDVRVLATKILKTIEDHQTCERPNYQDLRCRRFGRVVYVGSKAQCDKSIVGKHIDFMTSNAWGHPALVVACQETHDGHRVFTCLKLTSDNLQEHWIDKNKGATIGSIWRALFYVPIEHKRIDPKRRHVYSMLGLPMLQQMKGQHDLKVPTVINTERAFQIEENYLRPFRCHWHGFSRCEPVLTLESMRTLAKRILDTPMLRYYDGYNAAGVPQRTEGPRFDLSNKGIQELGRYISSGVDRPFNRRAWMQWLDTKGIARRDVARWKG